MILSSSLEPLLPLGLQPGVYLFLTLFSGWTPHIRLLYPVLIPFYQRWEHSNFSSWDIWKPGRKKVVHNPSSRKTRSWHCPCREFRTLLWRSALQKERQSHHQVQGMSELAGKSSHPSYITSEDAASYYSGYQCLETKTNAGRIQGQLKWLSTVGLGTREVWKNSVTFWMFSIKNVFKYRHVPRVNVSASVRPLEMISLGL